MTAFWSGALTGFSLLMGAVALILAIAGMVNLIWHALCGSRAAKIMLAVVASASFCCAFGGLALAFNWLSIR